MFKYKHFFIIPNETIIGDNFYRFLKSFSGMLNNYDFINHINYQITENNRYPLYKIKRKNIFRVNDIEVNNKNSFDEQQLVCSTKNLNNNNKRIILVDDEKDVLLLIRLF